MKKTKTQFLTQAAMIAAFYVVITVALAPISFGEIQFRVSEALTILPVFTPAAIPGLFLGCLIANMLGKGIILLDIVIGSFATLIGAIGTYSIRKHKKLATLPPIIANALLVPFVIKYGYGAPLPIPVLMVTVGIGEILSCGVFGMIVMRALEKTNIFSSTTSSNIKES